MERTMVTLREDQSEWLEENQLNLSAFLRDRLDDKIEQRNNQ
ncbi:MAG: hypothetical protein J07HQW2_03706 [Haloquadratum walsbyi J07HQW2]|uniref:CopG family ribbon-helix-helix protein n=1 Tax=Haloquadratum walsbyi J07HQW2 TaxID=1238425 RepID=U1NJ00_9EURY|nr:MAG: hypothetical protein J07HQW2_03706 [Haloquadratum walsbyi J07HQW2]